MNAIVVDSENTLNLEEDLLDLDYSKDSREIASEIYNRFKDNLTMETCFDGNKPRQEVLHIFVNIEGKYGGAKRQEQKGVDILKWLRCKHRICNPVILYSFQSVIQLLKKEPKNLIIISEGCYHYQLPYDFSSLKDKVYPGIKDFEKLKKFLKSAFDISQFRHAHANWWGVKCLWDVHSILNPESIKDYPKSIKDRFETLDGMLAQFLYGLKEGQLHYEIEKILYKYQKFNDEITKLLINLKDQSEYISSEISNYSGNIENLKKRKLATTAILSNIDELIKKDEYQILENSPGFPDFISNLKISLTNFDKSIDDCIETIKYFENEESKVEDQENKFLFEKADLPSKMEKELSNVIDLQKLPNTYSPILKKINVDTNDLKILYIDDMGQQGWSEIFQKMIYSHKDAQRFQTLEPNEFLTDNNLLINKIRTFKPNCILLDLRLKNEMGAISDVASLSGAKVLKEIHSRFPTIPVIMVTASNKAYSLRALKELGAYEMWTKEGIDDEMNVNETLINYFDLLSKIYSSIEIFKIEFNKAVYELGIEYSKIDEIIKISPDYYKNKVVYRNELGYTKNISSFDICITDTNIWCDTDDFINNHKLLNILAQCYHRVKPLISGFKIYHGVLLELISHSQKKPERVKNGLNINYINIIQSSKHSIEKIINFYSDGICDYDNNIKSIKGLEVYADNGLCNYMVELVVNNPSRKILFLTNDRELKSSLLTILGHGVSQSFNFLDKLYKKIDELKIDDIKFKELDDKIIEIDKDLIAEKVEVEDNWFYDFEYSTRLKKRLLFKFRNDNESTQILLEVFERISNEKLNIEQLQLRLPKDKYYNITLQSAKELFKKVF